MGHVSLVTNDGIVITMVRDRHISRYHSYSWHWSWCVSEETLPPLRPHQVFLLHSSLLASRESIFPSNAPSCNQDTAVNLGKENSYIPSRPAKRIICGYEICKYLLHNKLIVLYAMTWRLSWIYLSCFADDAHPGVSFHLIIVTTSWNCEIINIFSAIFLKLFIFLLIIFQLINSYLIDPYSYNFLSVFKSF